MSSKYKITDPEGVYFITCTTIGWVDVFTRPFYKDCLLDSFKYCIANKGLSLHAYVVMTNHFHAIVSTQAEYDLVATIRDMKKFVAKAILRLIASENESRKEWMLNKFAYEAKRTKKGQKYTFWQEGYHAKQLITPEFQMQKLDYIHQNPVVEGWVGEAEHYLYSSASNYAGLPSLIEVDFLY